MFTVTLEFAERLRTLLHRPLRRNDPVQRTLNEKTSIKDVIESCGVPHTEVDLIVRLGEVNESVGFAWQVETPARLQIHAAPVPLEVMPSSPCLQARGCRRFVADGHLGKLARNLRLLGFDTVFERDADDLRLLEIMAAEDRALLTRDRRLLMHAIVRHGCCPRSSDSEKQTREVLDRFDLLHDVDPSAAFQRCLLCNATLHPVAKADVRDQLADEPLTLEHFDTFFLCAGCGQVYWPGTHFEKLSARATRLLADGTSSAKARAP